MKVGDLVRSEVHNFYAIVISVETSVVFEDTVLVYDHEGKYTYCYSEELEIINKKALDKICPSC